MCFLTQSNPMSFLFAFSENSIYFKSVGGDTMPMLFIVTGANGHLGNSICRLLKNQNQDVRGFILPSDSDKMLKELGVQIYRGDIRSKDSLEPLFDLSNTKYTNDDIAVIHTAGIVSISHRKNPLLVAVNVTGTKNITDLCLTHH